MHLWLNVVNPRSDSWKPRSLFRIGFWLLFGLGVAGTSGAFRHAGAFSRSASDVSVSTAGKEGREIVFDDFWATINDRYYDGRFNGVDWNGIRDTYRERAVSAGTTEEFYSVLREMVGLLHDVHT